MTIPGRLKTTLTSPLALLLAACGTRVSSPLPEAAQPWLVLVSSGSAGAAALDRLHAAGWTAAGPTSVPGMFRLQGIGTPEGEGVLGAWCDREHPIDTGHLRPAIRLAASAPVAGTATGTPWNMALIRAPEALERGHDGRGIVVAVVDSGLDPGHPDFTGAVDWEHGHNLVEQEPFTDLNGHGTHVAGIIGARHDGQGITGVAPACTLRIIKVLDQRGYGHDHLVMEGVLRAAREGADVINVSIGTRLAWGTPEAGALTLAWDRTLREALRLGALVVTGTGNDGEAERTSGWTHLPAARPWALVATACGPLMGQDPARLAPWANHGPGLAGVVAPGGGLEQDALGNPRVLDPDDLIWSTWSREAPSGATWQGWAGTSMAAAHVSGAAALARQVRPDLKGTALGDWIRATGLQGDPGHPPLLQCDRLDGPLQAPRP